MIKTTSQEKIWQGKFGNDYTARNYINTKGEDRVYLKNYGISRTKLNEEFIGKLNRSIRILEIGSNVGLQLRFLQEMGFKNLYGIEINRETVERSKKFIKEVNIIQGSALDVPFKNNYFDLVFTSGVLIHISPKDIKYVMNEIYRCSNKYIWGFEFYADKFTEIFYRGNKNLHWKANYSKLYNEYFKNLKLIKERKLEYLDNSGKVDSMFLLKKNEK